MTAAAPTVSGMLVDPGVSRDEEPGMRRLYRLRKNSNAVILSEAKNLSLFFLLALRSK